MSVPPVPLSQSTSSHSLSNFTHLFSIQLASRIFSFILNALILRYILTYVYGIASIQFPLILAIILFLSREGCRKAVLRLGGNFQKTVISTSKGNNDGSSTPSLVNLSLISPSLSLCLSLNLAWLSLLFSIVVSIIVWFSIVFYLRAINMMSSIGPIAASTPSDTTTSIPTSNDTVYNSRIYLLCIGLVIIAAVIECAAEPFYTLIQVTHHLAVRAKIEIIALIIKTIFIYCFIIYIYYNCIHNSDSSKNELLLLLPFAIGQVVFSLCLLSGYIINFMKTISLDPELRTILLPSFASTNTSQTPSSTVAAMQESGLQCLKSMLPTLYQSHFNPSQSNSNTVNSSNSKTNESISLIECNTNHNGIRWFEGYFPSSLLQLTIALTYQSLLKFILTEFEKLILIFTTTHHEQGVYGLVSNLGSLVARMVLQPLEETALLMFASLYYKASPLADDTSSMTPFTNLSTPGCTNHPKHDSRVRDGSIITKVPGSNSAKIASLVKAVHALATLTKLVVYFGIFLVLFGSLYNNFVILFLYGRQWQSEASHNLSNINSLLSYYLIYVFIMGLNGIVEAFTYAVVKADNLSSMNKVMITISFIYVILAMFLLNSFQSYGLITANCINMILRIIYGYIFIYYFIINGVASNRATSIASNQESSESIFRILRSNSSLDYVLLVLFLICYVFLYYLQYYLSLRFHNHYLSYAILFIGVGLICFLLLLYNLYIREKHFLLEVVALWKKQKY